MLFKVVDWICCRLANTIMFLLSLWPRRNEYDFSPSKGKKHVLVVANSLLGDALMPMPFFASLRRELSKDEFHIAILLTPAIAKLYSGLQYFDEIVVSEHLCCRHPLKWIFTSRGFLDNSLRWALCHKVDIYLHPFPMRYRNLGYDYILRLVKAQKSIAYESQFMGKLFPMTAAYQMKHCDRLYTHLFPVGCMKSQVEELSKMLVAATGNDSAKLVPPSLEELHSILSYNLADKLPQPYVVFVPGAGAERRRWRIERFNELAKMLGGTIVVVGTADEFALGDKISGAVNLCGKTSLKELGGILANARLVVANETGSASFAAVVQSPILCLLGGGDFNAFFPNSLCASTRSVYHKEDCFGCDWYCRKTDTSCSVAPCIDSIGVDEVYAIAREMLDESRKTIKGNV